MEVDICSRVVVMLDLAIVYAIREHLLVISLEIFFMVVIVSNVDVLPDDSMVVIHVRVDVTVIVAVDNSEDFDEIADVVILNL